MIGQTHVIPTSGTVVYSLPEETIFSHLEELSHTIQSIFNAAIRTLKSGYESVSFAWKNAISLCIIPARALSLLDVPVFYEQVPAAFATWMASHPHDPIAYEEKQLQVAEGVTLDGVEISYHTAPEQKSQRNIVYLLPNGKIWPLQMKELCFLSSSLRANVICYNYRGCGRSGGVPLSQDEVVSDAIKIVEPQVRQGRVFIHSYSLGGGIAMQVLKHFEDRGISLGSCNERSFQTITKILKALNSLYTPVGWIASWTGWTLNSEEVLPTLRGQHIFMSHPHDDVILPEAQLAQSARGLNRPNFHFINMDPHGDHNTRWHEGDRAAYIPLVENYFAS
jgi:hypothetical protein